MCWAQHHGPALTVALGLCVVPRHQHGGAKGTQVPVHGADMGVAGQPLRQRARGDAGAELGQVGRGLLATAGDEGTGVREPARHGLMTRG